MSWTVGMQPRGVAELFCGAAGVTCLAILMTSSGAFDTDDLSVPHRYALWQIVCTLIVGQAVLLETRLARLLPERTQYRRLAAGGAVLLTVLLMSIELHALKFTPLLPKEPDPPLEFLLFVAPPVAAIAVATLLRRNVRVGALAENNERDVHAGNVVPAGPADMLVPVPQPSLADIHAWPDSPVLHVQADDHYLHVVTAQGTSFIRGRMKDALARLREADGLQAHRSHWVSSDAVAKVVLRGRDYHLRLKDGTEIPVARSRIAEMRAKGWL